MKDMPLCSICFSQAATLTITSNDEQINVCQDCADLKLEEETPSENIIIDTIEEGPALQFSQHCTDLLNNYRAKLRSYVQSLKELQEDLMDQLAMEIQRNIESLQEDIIEVDYKLRQITSDSAIPTGVSNLNIDEVKIEHLLKQPQKLMNIQVDQFKSALSSLVKFSSHRIEDLTSHKLVYRYAEITKPRKLKSANPIIYPKFQSPIHTTPPVYPPEPIPTQVAIPECKLPETSHGKSSEVPNPLKKQISGSHLLFLPVSKSRNISIYDPEKNSVSEIPALISQDFPNYYRFCILSTGDIFLCGGRSNFSEENRLNLKYLHRAYIIKLPSFTTELLPSMITSREDHAVIQYKESIYVFGGFNGRVLSSVEEFNLPTKHWEIQPEMSKGISNFNVCIVKNKIFIPGIGMYDPDKKEYEIMYLGDIMLYVPYWKDDKVYAVAKAATNLRGNEVKIECFKCDKGLVTWGNMVEWKEKVYFLKGNCKEVYEMNLKNKCVSCILSY
jgi:hypothetical protein